MHNPKETAGLLDLQERLGSERDMIGWLCTVHRNQVHYKDNPSASSEIQEQLNRASNLISLAYMFALLEEHGFDERSPWLTADEQLELKAWKHIRHTGAHAPGGRAHRYAQEFENYMTSSGAGLSGLKQNCTYTATSINLKDGMNYRFFEFVVALIQKALGRCASDLRRTP